MIRKEAIFQIQNESQFKKSALEVFYFQAKNNPIYRQYLKNLGINEAEIKEIEHIPFLPISFFKTHQIVSNQQNHALIFSSSGTTGQNTSKHFVTDPAWYETSYLNTFNQFYGDICEYCILALLPSYLERQGSSLIYMVEDLIQKSKHPQSNFFLHNHQKLQQTLLHLKKQQQKTILIGVSFALLDFVEQYPISFPELIVMETGGMKGKRKELIRKELHQILCKGFDVENIHAEYGMTELLSQAYSKGGGLFETPPYMKILIRDPNDPLSLQAKGKSGGINVIDLANVYSCAFIATQDLGKIHPNGMFEILGRFDHTDIRGCNLLIQ